MMKPKRYRYEYSKNSISLVYFILTGRNCVF